MVVAVQQLLVECTVIFYRMYRLTLTTSACSDKTCTDQQRNGFQMSAACKIKVNVLATHQAL